MSNHEIFAYRTLLSAILYLFWGCCLGDGGSTFLFYDYLELMVQTLKILTDACTSRIVRGQSTLKDAIERYFWNGLSRERLKAVKALYALKAMKHANAGADPRISQRGGSTLL